MMQGLTLLALGSPVAAGAAPKGIDTRNSAGLDVNKKSRFEDLDISSAINKPVGAPVEEPPAQKQAPTQSAIFADDALGYAFAVPPSFQGQSKAIDNGGQIIAFTDVSLNPPDITKRITLVAQPVPISTLQELQESLDVDGKAVSTERVVKEKGKEDGEVLVIEQEQASAHILTVFALRVRPRGSEATWLVSLSAQAAPDAWPEYEKRFRDVVKSFKLIYPGRADNTKNSKPPAAQSNKSSEYIKSTEAADEELGKKFKDLKETEGIDFKFGG